MSHERSGGVRTLEGFLVGRELAAYGVEAEEFPVSPQSVAGSVEPIAALPVEGVELLDAFGVGQRSRGRIVCVVQELVDRCPVKRARDRDKADIALELIFCLPGLSGLRHKG